MRDQPFISHSKTLHQPLYQSSKRFPAISRSSNDSDLQTSPRPIPSPTWALERRSRATGPKGSDPVGAPSPQGNEAGPKLHGLSEHRDLGWQSAQLILGERQLLEGHLGTSRGLS